MPGEYDSTVEANLAAMHREHTELIRSGHRWSLRELFSTTDCDIADYCRDFRPSPFGAQACAEVERFCRHRDIWLEAGGEHYNSMTPYLHPHAVTAERMRVIGLFNAILFWLNDTVGREKFAQLPAVRQRQAAVTVERLCRMLETRCPPDAPTPVEAATAELLTLLASDADPEWLRHVLNSTVEHLRPAIRDQNARARGDLLSVEDYIALRSDVSGMYPAIDFCEYGRDAYLDRDRIRSAGADADLRRLRQLTAEIGALMNDMFSFEKECIVDGADFNLIPICLLNTAGATLSDAVEQSARLVRDRLTEFRRLRAALAARCAPGVDARLGPALAYHLDDLEASVQATWVWQLSTMRYKGISIFTENQPG